MDYRPEWGLLSENYLSQSAGLVNQTKILIADWTKVAIRTRCFGLLGNFDEQYMF